MRFSDWLPTYEEIMKDMGYDRTSDETTARLLKTIMMNANLIEDDELTNILSGNVVVTGGAPFDVKDIPKETTVIATGASIPLLLDFGIVPDIIVTDLDGDVESQKKASRCGSVTVMHAHGDNVDAIMEHAKDFFGKVILTTQSEPDNVILNFGGFTDGDRAVCMARHFNASHIFLIGFDFIEPVVKDGCDPNIKKKKLKWAERIIFEAGKNDVTMM